jgi:adenosine deaminase
VSEKVNFRHKVFYKSLPKVELHRHLEGSIRLSTMVEIARKYKLDLPYGDLERFRPLVQVVDGEPFNFQNFLSKFASIRKFFQSEEVIRQITRDVIADAANDNVRYFELRFTPVALTRIRDYPLGEAMDWVIESAEEASRQYGITTKLIASVNRHESVKLAEEVVQLAIDRKDRGVVALDLAGSEAEYPGEEFAGVFREAKESGLFITIHAGEWGGPGIVRLAIEKLYAERIGHGVRVMEDPEVVALARDRKIVFEVCPTSNYQSGIFPSLEEHPLTAMIEAGLRVTVNTDDPAISQIELSDEYELACETFQIDLPTFTGTIIDAARSAFMVNHEKDALIASLEKELAEKISE